MSTLVICDYKDCGEPATYRITAQPVNDTEAPANPELVGIDTCDDHYAITHPGKVGGGWWDDRPAPQGECRCGKQLDRQRQRERTG